MKDIHRIVNEDWRPKIEALPFTVWKFLMEYSYSPDRVFRNPPMYEHVVETYRLMLQGWMCYYDARRAFIAQRVPTPDVPAYRRPGPRPLYWMKVVNWAETYVDMLEIGRYCEWRYIPFDTMRPYPVRGRELTGTEWLWLRPEEEGGAVRTWERVWTLVSPRLRRPTRYKLETCALPTVRWFLVRCFVKTYRKGERPGYKRRIIEFEVLLPFPNFYDSAEVLESIVPGGTYWNRFKWLLYSIASSNTVITFMLTGEEPKGIGATIVRLIREGLESEEFFRIVGVQPISVVYRGRRVEEVPVDMVLYRGEREILVGDHIPVDVWVRGLRFEASLYSAVQWGAGHEVEFLPRRALPWHLPPELRRPTYRDIWSPATKAYAPEWRRAPKGWVFPIEGVFVVHPEPEADWMIQSEVGLIEAYFEDERVSPERKYERYRLTRGTRWPRVVDETPVALAPTKLSEGVWWYLGYGYWRVPWEWPPP